MEDLDFKYQQMKNSEVVITHKGRLAVSLRGKKAQKFIEQTNSLSFIELQQLMARLTGNYKHGNEKLAKNHPRNKL